MSEFVYPGCLHFDNSALNKIDDVLTEHGGLLHVLPLAVQLKYFFDRQTCLELGLSLDNK